MRFLVLLFAILSSAARASQAPFQVCETLLEARKALLSAESAFTGDNSAYYPYYEALDELTKSINAQVTASHGKLFYVIPMDYNYAGEFIKGFLRDAIEYHPYAVEYYRTEKERAAIRLVFKNGLVYDAQGNLFDTSGGTTWPRGRNRVTTGMADFVMDTYGDFYALLHTIQDKIHHSTALAGEPVAAAGEIKVENGHLLGLNDKSKHYMVPDFISNQALESLKRHGVDTKNVTVKHVYSHMSVWRYGVRSIGIPIPQDEAATSSMFLLVAPGNR